ncbi:MAG: DUF3604 domain-containing protein [Nitratireductor sp.]|nr:DUF3604 domain-containing protein [Nitratireductor sp.]
MPKVESHLVGQVFPAAEPGEDPVLYGSVDISPKGAFEARSLQTFTVTYTVGRFGLDDTGAIKLAFRHSNDWGMLQFTDPAAVNYVTATASNGTPLSLSYTSLDQRPWYRSITVLVTGGCLSEGDTITITLGDRSGGSPGVKVQTFCESGLEFKLLADVCATGQFIPIPDSPSIEVVPGPVARWKAILPTLRRPGEAFRLGIKAEDLWGNPTDQAEGMLTLTANMNVTGLPETVHLSKGSRAVVLEGLSVAEEGTLRITVADESGTRIAETPPLIVRDCPRGGYWADMHGQSGETVGINTAREYFSFARDLAFLDATGHQANDFQINNAFWQLINDLAAEYNEDHRFVTFPGYEWSGNTAVGGDRNVYFRNEGRQIRRSSHALLPDRSDLDTDANTAARLFEDLQDEDCVIYAHVGGRYADIAMAHDPRLETAMEIHSAWGTFEWLLTDGFPLGHRAGVVCNSDGHKGRPGASYPGAATYGAYGGLTCFLAEELTRDGLFECLRRRHHYGTTGNRLHLDVQASFSGGAQLYERDPRYFDVAAKPVDQVMMGDIASTGDEAVELSIECVSATPIERIDILNGSDVIDTLYGYAPEDLGNRVRVVWQGAEYRGRGRQTLWKGHATFSGNRILRMEKVNAWNHERPVEQASDHQVTWDTLTTGNFGGFDAWLEGSLTGTLDIETGHVCGQVEVPALGMEDVVFNAGGLERAIRVFRLPETNTCRDFKCSVKISLKPRGDNPIWVRVTTEDGFNAWSSPIFLYREE